MTISIADKALSALKSLPRFTINHLNEMPREKIKFAYRRGKKNRPRIIGAKHGRGRNRWKPLGYQAYNTPIQESTPIEPTYNLGFESKKQYPPLSLKTLQLMIDLDRINPDKPVDLASICNSKVFQINSESRHYGVNLTAEGSDCFASRINIEVQRVDEEAIAAIERTGGVITTAYYDILSVRAMSDAKRHFMMGNPVPRRLTPPPDLIDYYTDPKNRGYLANPKDVAEHRLMLAQKYGYELEYDVNEYIRRRLSVMKDPRQVFYGLSPGMVVDLNEKKIFQTMDAELLDYYSNEFSEEANQNS